VIACRVSAVGSAALLLCAAGITMPVELPAQQPAAVDADLVWAVTGGGWRLDEEVGRHRVLVYCGGFEHITCSVFVQWIRDPAGSEQGAAIVASEPVRAINDSFTWSLDQPTFARRRDGVIVVRLRMGNSHEPDAKERICSLRLGPPRQMAVHCRPE
jgi:hypothetical protein